MCAIAGVATPDWIQDESLPIVDGAPGRERMVCEWDSQFPGYGMHLRSVHTVRGGDGNDTIYGDFFAQATGITEGTGMSGWADTISGDKGNDLIYSQSSDDVIHGNEGGDVISGQAGWDLLLGDAGTDVVRGGPGGDVLHGGLSTTVFATHSSEIRAPTALRMDSISTRRPAASPLPTRTRRTSRIFGVCPDPPR